MPPFLNKDFKSKLNMKKKEEIEKALEDSLQAVEDYSTDEIEIDDPSCYIYQGWVEALEYVLELDKDNNDNRTKNSKNNS